MMGFEKVHLLDIVMALHLVIELESQMARMSGIWLLKWVQQKVSSSVLHIIETEQ